MNSIHLNCKGVANNAFTININIAKDYLPGATGSTLRVV